IMLRICTRYVSEATREIKHSDNAAHQPTLLNARMDFTTRPARFEDQFPVVDEPRRPGYCRAYWSCWNQCTASTTAQHSAVPSLFSAGKARLPQTRKSPCYRRILSFLSKGT